MIELQNCPGKGADPRASSQPFPALSDMSHAMRLRSQLLQHAQLGAPGPRVGCRLLVARQQRLARHQLRHAPRLQRLQERELAGSVRQLLLRTRAGYMRTAAVHNLNVCEQLRDTGTAQRSSPGTGGSC